MTHFITTTATTRTVLRSTGALGAAAALTVTVLLVAARVVGSWN